MLCFCYRERPRLTASVPLRTYSLEMKEGKGKMFCGNVVVFVGIFVVTTQLPEKLLFAIF